MTGPRVVLDYGNALIGAIGSRGIDPERLTGDLGERFRTAFLNVEQRRAGGEMGFFQLPHAPEIARSVQEVADSFGQWFEDLVVLGIGGSSLGARTLRDALLGSAWNGLSDARRSYYPRIHIVDSIDPTTVAAVLEELDPRRTLFNVVSKSGSTAETMAQYLIARERVAEVVDAEKVHGHFLFTTDEGRGALRGIAEEEGIPTLAIPANVGGRFSVLSPVGLLPAAACGIDTNALLAGAARMEVRCRAETLGENPAGLLAVLLQTAHVESGASIHVLMPYCDRLRTFAAWFQQLWGESLGKEQDSAEGVAHVGPTPLPAIGAADQHSLLQLFMEGPRDKVIVFLAVGDVGASLAIPSLHAEVEELAYLGGHTLSELLDTERRATAEALRQVGRPTLTVEMDRLDAEGLGELFMLFQAATVYAAALYGVDALDQPGVERGKQITYGLMGRPGFEASVPEPAERNEQVRWRV